VAAKAASKQAKYSVAADGTVSFTTKLAGDKASSACSVNFPFKLKDVFGTTRVPVKITLNGHAFRTTTFRMGDNEFFVVNKEMREATGLGAGDAVKVTMKRDAEERTVDVPPELEALLQKNPREQAYFDSLAYTHRKEYARWIAGAKKEETRARRLEKCLEMLKAHEAPHF